MPWLIRWILVSVVVPYVWKRRETILRLVSHMLGRGDSTPEPNQTP